MLRKIIAGTAVAGALTFGAAGIAGAATPTTPSPGSDGSSGANLSTLCAKLPQLQSKVQQLESKVNARIPEAQAREAKAKAAGHTKLANAIANRITRCTGSRVQAEHPAEQARGEVRLDQLVELDRRLVGKVAEEVRHQPDEARL